MKVIPKKIITDMPEDLREALAEKDIAAEFFNGLAPSYKRDYIEWIESAKREWTRKKRLGTTLEWLQEGKKKNWKYQ